MSKNINIICVVLKPGIDYVISVNTINSVSSVFGSSSIGTQY